MIECRYPATVTGVIAAVLMLVMVGTASARDPEQVIKFRQTHPCPITNLTTGPCPGYVVDHMYPLCAGGPDDPSNMQWQEYGQSLVKDRIERDLCACLNGWRPKP